MRLFVAVLLRHPWDYEIACRPIAGAPWLTRLVDRLRRARSVRRIVVLTWGGYAATNFEHLALRSTLDLLAATDDDPLLAARAVALPGDGIVLCPVHQLFADPDRLDGLASLAASDDATVVRWVVEGNVELPMAGGTCFDIVVPRGPDAPRVDAVATRQRVASHPIRPDPPEARLEEPSDFEWAAAAYEELLMRGAAFEVESFEAAITGAGIGRFSFWDRIGPPPRRLLVVRCVRRPLFEMFVRHLARIPGSAIDVLCGRALVDETRTITGVRRVISYAGDRLSTQAVGEDGLESLRAARYDLTVIPCVGGAGAGMENVMAVGEAVRARTTIWLEPSGRSGLVSGTDQGWDATRQLDDPSRWLERLEAEADRALAFFESRGRPGPATDESEEAIARRIAAGE